MTTGIKSVDFEGKHVSGLKIFLHLRHYACIVWNDIMYALFEALSDNNST